MDQENAKAQAPETTDAVGAEQLKEFTEILQKYKAGKSRTERRIVSSENWWKLRNSTEEQKSANIGRDGGFKSVSGWLHNVIVSKHADALEAYPEPNILPREEGDRAEAGILSAVIPCILSTKIPVTIPQILVLWVERVILSILLAGAVALVLL